MHFSWSTFFLEIINFLVLVWILKRLLYLPVKKAILQRKQAIQESLDQAAKLANDAKHLEDKYKNRLNDWEKEQEEKRKILQQELVELKTKKLEELAKILTQEREKNQFHENRRLQMQMESNLKESRILATKFSSKFLSNFADAELENKLIAIFCKDLLHLSAEQLERLRQELAIQESIQVQTAFPLNAQQKQKITMSFTKLLDGKVNLNFNQNSKLLAGINVLIGAMVLQANLRDELKFFAEVVSGSFQR